MNQTFALAFLVPLAVMGALRAPTADAIRPPPNPPSLAAGAVRVDVGLESPALPAGHDLETYARVRLEGVQAPRQAMRLPLSVTVVIDQSGSMGGEKIESARESALRVLEQLAPGDVASVIAFSSGAEVLVSRLVIGKDSLDDARRAIRALRAQGGTDMVSGLRRAEERALALHGDGRVNRILLLSDGQPDTESGLQAMVAGLARRGVHTTTLGVGRDYNEDLMARLADAGLGNYWFVESPAQMAHIFTNEIETLATVVAKEAVVTLVPRTGVEVMEVAGWEVSRAGSTLAIPVGDIYGGKRAEMLVRLRVSGTAAGSARELLEVRVGYHDAIAGRDQRTAHPLLAHFTRDEGAVRASRDLEVSAKAEEVRAALALERASAAVARGDADEARRISREARARASSLAASAGAAYAPAAAEMDRAFVELEEAAEGRQDAAVAQKRAKSMAREWKR